MKIEPLSKADKKIIKSDIIQVTVAFLTIMILVSAVFSIGFIVIQEPPNEFISKNKSEISLAFTIVVLTTSGFFYYRTLKDPISDLRATS